MFKVFKFFLFLNFLKHERVTILLWDAFKFSRFPKNSIPSKLLNLLQLISKYFNFVRDTKYLLNDAIWLFERSNWIKFMKEFNPCKLFKELNLIWMLFIDVGVFICFISGIWLKIFLSLANKDISYSNSSFDSLSFSSNIVLSLLLSFLLLKLIF